MTGAYPVTSVSKSLDLIRDGIRLSHTGVYAWGEHDVLEKASIW